MFRRAPVGVTNAASAGEALTNALSSATKMFCASLAPVRLIVSTLPYDRSTFMLTESVTAIVKVAVPTLRSTGARRFVYW